MTRVLLILIFLFLTKFSFAQEKYIDTLEIRNELLDSLYIAETEHVTGEKDKVLHAEPLFIDLIRDLGARKGEQEWNVGVGMVDMKNFDNYIALIEYECAPVDRLGVEVELPFSFYYPLDTSINHSDIPQSKLNGLKLATQYSFFVNEKISTSMAVGYIHEFELPSFDKYGKERMYTGNSINPFLIAARRWGNHFHTLLYTGPVIKSHFKGHSVQSLWQVNSNIHYMISGTKNFVGLELNKEIRKKDFDMVIRPQMRLAVSNRLLVGIVTGIPIKRENQRFSTFVRLIYEPKHKTKHS